MKSWLASIRRLFSRVRPRSEAELDRDAQNRFADESGHGPPQDAIPKTNTMSPAVRPVSDKPR